MGDPLFKMVHITQRVKIYLPNHKHPESQLLDLETKLAKYGAPACMILVNPPLVLGKNILYHAEYCDTVAQISQRSVVCGTTRHEMPHVTEPYFLLLCKCVIIEYIIKSQIWKAVDALRYQHIRQSISRVCQIIEFWWAIVGAIWHLCIMKIFAMKCSKYH